MWALLDTGSPISLIRPSIYKKFFNSNDNDTLPKVLFKIVNNVPINILKIISTSIVLQVLPDFKANIDLHVLENDSFSLDLIIGRDFFKNNFISVLYNPSGENLQNKIRLFQEIASAEIVGEVTQDLETELSNIDIDFDSDTLKQLIHYYLQLSTIMEVENTVFPPTQDEYLVKIKINQNLHLHHVDLHGRNDCK